MVVMYYVSRQLRPQCFTADDFHLPFYDILWSCPRPKFHSWLHSLSNDSTRRGSALQAWSCHPPPQEVRAGIPAVPYGLWNPIIFLNRYWQWLYRGYVVKWVELERWGCMVQIWGRTITRRDGNGKEVLQCTGREWEQEGFHLSTVIHRLCTCQCLSD